MHSGKKVSIKFKPAKENTGIVFIRTDMPGSPKTEANLNNISSTARGTNLGKINTVEHVLSALYALSITNLYVELDGPEPPALDGSSKQYCELIVKAGIIEQDLEIKCIEVKEPVFTAEEGKCLIAVPSDRFIISFMINYPLGFIGTQFYKFELSRACRQAGGKKYMSDIAPARTYGFLDEVGSLKRQGLALGASEKNAVAIAKDGYLTKLRFNDELVRHKILDLIGDMSLLGAEIKAHIIGIRSGHDLNIKFARTLLREFQYK